MQAASGLVGDSNVALGHPPTVLDQHMLKSMDQVFVVVGFHFYLLTN